MMAAFECSKCGACCRAVGAIPSMASYDRGDGGCKYLTDDNRCAIYATRPVLCRVDVMRPVEVTEETWNALNHEACARLHLQVYGQEIRR